jgi:glycosyltransferase involved in cell wall biosynthesis
MRQSWGVDNNTFLIGTVSRLIPAKALDILLKGFATYLQLTSVPTKLVVVGAGTGVMKIVND